MNSLISRLLFNTVWAIESEAANAEIILLINALKGIPPTGDLEFARKESLKIAYATAGKPYSISDYGGYKSPEDAPENSVAIVSIADTIYKYDMDCGPAGMKTKANILKRIDANKNIIGCVLVIDSPGGEGSAARLMNDTINSMNKPVIAHVEDMATSAGYYIASACDAIYARTNQAILGSIGTYITIADFSERLKQCGISVKEIYADKSTDKNKDYYDAVEFMKSDGKSGSLDGIKFLVNKFNENFLSDVKANRSDKLNAQDDLWNTGRLIFADEAQTIGLIDGIDSLENIIDKFY